MKALHLLVVEDVAEMRELMSQFLEALPEVEAVELAENGWQARLSVQRIRPDLILLDEILPGESSLDLLKDWAHDGIPVILLTSMDRPSTQLPKGAKLRLKKPAWRNWGKEKDVYSAAFASVLDSADSNC